jgi:MFS family permease
VLAIPPVVWRNTWLLAGTQAFVGVGNQMVPALGAIMMLQLLGTPTWAGLATATLGVCRLLVAYPAGYVADAYGRRASLLTGLVLSLIGSLLLGLAMAGNSFPAFVGGLGLFGLGVGIGQQLRLAAADMYPPARRAQGLGYVLTGALVGALGGPLLVSLAQLWAPPLGQDPLTLAWLLVPAIILPGIALVRLIRPDPRQIAAALDSYYPGHVDPLTPPSDAPRSTLRGLLRRYPPRVACLTSFAVHGNMSLIMAMTSLALAHHGYALPAISVAVAIHVVGMYGLSLPLGRLADRVGRRNVLLAATVVAGVGSTLVAAPSAYWVVTAGTFLVGLGWSGMNVAVAALLADTVPPLERGRAIGVTDAVSALSSIVLPLLAGPLVALAGIASLAPVSWGLLAAPFLFLLRLQEPSPGRYGPK